MTSSCASLSLAHHPRKGIVVDGAVHPRPTHLEFIRNACIHPTGGGGLSAGRPFPDLSSFLLRLPIGQRKHREFLAKASSVEYAEFHQKLNADAAILLCVPTEGYCTYESKVGVKYPAMKGDWTAETIRELHKRNIKAFVYVTLGWHLKYLAEHPEYSSACWYGPRTICLNSPYLDMIREHCREMLKGYPVDGLRFDILEQGSECRCKGCKRYYRELFRQTMPAKWTDERRRDEFRRMTLLRALRRLYETCKAINPSVEIWHNQLNLYHNVPLEALAYVDLAYMEYGDAFGQLFHVSAAGKVAVIVGKMENLPPDQRRLCMALGARGYTYILARHFDCLPPATEKEAQAWRVERGWTNPGPRENARSRREIIATLAPFYEMVSKIEPYLVDAKPVYHHVGVVYCEATRLRYKDYDRADYVKAMRGLGEAYLDRSVPLEFVNSPTLPSQNLRRFKALVLPETSGLKADELDALRKYMRNGGHVILTGEALRYDEQGLPLGDFALAKEMNLVANCNLGAKEFTSNVGKGKIIYMRRPDPAELVAKVDSLAKVLPVTVTGKGTKNVAILTHQAGQKRWILHLISDGAYTIEINKTFAAPRQIAEKYPAKGWTAKIQKTKSGVRIKVTGKATDRLLVLK